MILPDNKVRLLRRVHDIKDACRASASQRTAVCRNLNLWMQTGRGDGVRSLVNKMYAHIDRLSAHLFSPAELRFTMDFESFYPEDVLARGEVAARVLTREWERKDIDMMFGAAVSTSLQYGSCILKQMWGNSGVEARAIMPWQFGVYREDINNIDDQEALCESGLMTKEEVWRRISHLPDSMKLFKEIVSHSKKDESDSLNDSFFHNVMSTSVLQTDIQSVRQAPGGVVQLASDSSMVLMAPQVMANLIQYHEIWVRDDDRGDYTTILLIEPDIIISPWFKRENMFAPKVQPYSLIQANFVPGYFWGRSEIVDLMEPQGLLSTWLNDIKRLMGLQFDKLLAFSGAEGITNEKYDQFRGAGYIDMPPGAQVNDLTPPFPAQAFQAVEMISGVFEEIAGFQNILSGQGEPGVRAGNHAETLTKMASPRLRDRSLLVERQCAAAADKSLDLLSEKDDRRYVTDPNKQEESAFLLHNLPDDRRVTVDSHSSSPIFSESHEQLVGFGLKAGIVDGESAIEMLPYPRKDQLKQRYAKAQAAKAKMVQEHPELLMHGKGGKH